MDNSTEQTSTLQAKDLAQLVLDWWEEHQSDCAGEYNLYRETPAFVKAAITLNKEGTHMTPFKVPELTSAIVNEACWKVHETLPECPPSVFNNLKPAFYEGLKVVLEDLQSQAALPQAGQGGQVSYASADDWLKKTGRTLEAGCKEAELNLLRIGFAAGQGGKGEPAFWGFMDAENCRVELCFSPSAPRMHDGVYATAYYAAQPATVPAPMSEAQALEIAGRVSTCVEAIREAEAFHRSPSPVASAAGPMPADREAFEAWIAKDGGDLSKFGTGVNTHYYNSAVNNAWTGWQARARIGQQTAPAVPVRSDLESLKITLVELGHRIEKHVPFDEPEIRQKLQAAVVLVNSMLSAAPKPEQADKEIK